MTQLLSIFVLFVCPNFSLRWLLLRLAEFIRHQSSQYEASYKGSSSLSTTEAFSFT